MTETTGNRFVDAFKRFMPDSFVFAILLTLICAVLAAATVGAGPMSIISGWYKGFWSLLEFGMQMVLILATGFAIALSTPVGKFIDRLTRYISTPAKVYVFVVVAGYFFTYISWGWLVVTAVLARKLAERVGGIDYRYLVACVYLSGGGWVTGLSSSIPLVLNTDGNFLIEAGILSGKVPTSLTLGSPLNLAMIAFYVAVPPLLMYLLRPGEESSVEMKDLRAKGEQEEARTIAEEAQDLNLPYWAVSDALNNSRILSLIIFAMGGCYIFYYFATSGLDLNLNIMIFTFLMFGLLLHQTPMRYVIAMKRACSNISGIVFQYPFYAGIMGIMIHTGLGAAIGTAMASGGSMLTYPVYSYLAGAVVNFAIPSAGGEFAVLAPSVISAVKDLGAGLPPDVQMAMVAKASLAIAYGETTTNLLQPFFILIITPVMCAGLKLSARDIMGYLFIPFVVITVCQCLMVTFIPV
ncbi:MAG: short-chain fatty acid transporter [Aridibacter famidurans]|nr:short-chain fatty acid transporter [Aridibacter famidurans]